MVVFLDPRMKTKPYGRTFLESLPECRVVEE
jgi:ATP-dependent DNA helicase DinG